jgi:adenylate kinase family enzyme
VPPHRVWILGTSGSGKTTLAVAAAARLGVPHVELDALQHGPGWAQATPEELRERADSALAGDAWVVDGNYRIARDDHIDRAQQVVWLDYAHPIVMSRVVRRTAIRLVTRRQLYNGNRERWSNLVDPDHPVWWAWRTHAARRLEMRGLMDERWLRVRTPRDAARWLRSLARLC